MRRSIIRIALLSVIVLGFFVPSPNLAQSLPSNGKIAFASNQDGDYEIYVMDFDGSNIQQLTFNTADDDYPVWSPDGNRILFHSDRNGEIEVFVMNADGSNPTSLTPGLPSHSGRWSPDGTKIAFTVETNTSSKDIYIMNADGTNKVNLTNDATHINTLPFWSSDGGHLYFLTDRDFPRGTGADAPNLVVYAMNADGSNPTKVFGVGIGISSIDLSPDGTRIVWGAWRLNPATMVWNLNTSQETVLIDGMQAAGAYPAWSPDGTKIVFVSDGPSIAVMDANGGNPIFLLTLADTSIHLHNPDWQPIIEAPTTCSTTIPASDTAALIEAIDYANDAGTPSTLCLTEGIYTLDDAPVISGDITIVGDGATIEIASGGGFDVAAGGSLALRDVVVVGTEPE